MVAIPDKVDSVEIQEARTEFLASKLIDQIADDVTDWTNSHDRQVKVQRHPSLNPHFVVDGRVSITDANRLADSFVSGTVSIGGAGEAGLNSDIQRRESEVFGLDGKLK